MPGGRPPSKQASLLGQRIAQARQLAGFSQNQLAQKLGIGRTNIAQWERSAVALKPEQLAALADALGTSVEVFLGRDAPAKRAGGPVGRAKRTFEVVSKLPRSQQQKILDVVEALLKAS